MASNLYGIPNSSSVIDALTPLGVGQLYKVMLDDIVDNGALAFALRIDESCLLLDSALAGPEKIRRGTIGEGICSSGIGRKRKKNEV